MTDFPILSTMIALPLLGAILCLFVSDHTARRLALGVTIATFALGIMLWANYDLEGAQWQFAERSGNLLSAVRFLVGLNGRLALTVSP